MAGCSVLFNCISSWWLFGLLWPLLLFTSAITQPHSPMPVIMTIVFRDTLYVLFSDTFDRMSFTTNAHKL